MVSHWLFVYVCVCLTVCLLPVHPYICLRITSKYQWIFTKLGIYIDIEEIWFGVANGLILSLFDRETCP